MAMRKISLGAVIAVAVTGLFLTMVTAGVLTSSQTVMSQGTVMSAVNVGVYTNSQCTTNCTNIDWGTLSPGTSTTRTVYIKNTGSLPVTLSIGATNWVPSTASSYLSLTWNRGNYVLAVGSSVSATLTLTASTSAGSITNFSFDIVITGTQ
jgi:hypothetical protein